MTVNRGESLVFFFFLDITSSLSINGDTKTFLSSVA